MNDNYLKKEIINNEFDYSNIIPIVEAISYLVEFCDQMNNQLTKMIEGDEEKNIQFKHEYKNYMYKKSYTQQFKVYIREKTYNNITCNDYKSFLSAVCDGNLNNVDSLEIKLDLDFERGSGNNYDKHENSFTILFKPYNILFARKSNYNDPYMNKIEEQINSILKKFPFVNCIFCNKNK